MQSGLNRFLGAYTDMYIPFSYRADNISTWICTDNYQNFRVACMVFNQCFVEGNVPRDVEKGVAALPALSL
jgi:hypothetical protein